MDKGDPGPSGPAHPDDDHRDHKPAAARSLDQILESLADSQPAWEELKPFTDSAIRQGEPAFFKRALAWGEDIWKLQGFQGFNAAPYYYDSIQKEFSGNISNAIASEVPPWVDEKGNILRPPLTGDYLDKRIRAGAAVLLREKRLGRRVQYVNFTPPGMAYPRMKSKEEFLTWLRASFLPEKRLEAQAAEKIKAEYFIPFPLEFEVFMRTLGGYNSGGFLSSMGKGEIIAFANAVAQEIKDTVKSHYHGILVAHLYNNYHTGEVFWDDLAFPGYDQIHWALFATCDSATTEDYIDSLSLHYAKVAKNSGNIPYIVEEIAVLEKYASCVEDFAASEKGLWQAVFHGLERLSPPPIGLSVDQKHIVTLSAREYVKGYLREK